MFAVADLLVGELDANRVPVLGIYAKYDPRYAVYRTPERVSIQFGDDPELERSQRANLARLSPARGEINGLVDGWRAAKRPRFQSAAMRYDRRVADALIVALEGDVDSAAMILTEIRDDIVAERKSRARFLYLIWAAATAVLLGIAALIASSDAVLGAIWPGNPFAGNLWLAVWAGTLGAFFSIARALRDRSIRTDLQMSDNVTDAVLRILIGAVAALVLQALLDSGIFSLRIGSEVIGARASAIPLPPGTPPQPPLTPWLLTIVAGFVAGFSERLVPDLLSSASIAAADRPQTPAPSPTGAGVPATPPPAGEDEPAGAASEDEASATQGEANEEIDGCDVDQSNAGVPPTPDDKLPNAAGGVAQPQ